VSPNASGDQPPEGPQVYRVIEQLASWVDASMSSTSFSLSPSKATRKERITVWWLKTQTRSLELGHRQLDEELAHALQHVTPALPGRRPVVEPSQPFPTGGLIGVQVPDARCGDPVQQAQLTFAQTLVHLDRGVGPRCGGFRGVQRPHVGRAEYPARTLLGREPVKVLTESPG